MNNLDRKQQLEKRIHQQMNRTITQRVVKVFLVISVFVSACVVSMDFLLTSLYYNPKNEKAYLTERYYAEEDINDNFGLLFETYIKMFYPGYNSYVHTIEDTNFGTYKVDVSIVDYLSYRHFPPAVNATLKISQDKVKSFEYLNETERLLLLKIHEFDDPSTQEDNENFFGFDGNLEDRKEEILEFPDSSIVEASLSFNNYISCDDLASMIATYDASFYWAAVENVQHALVFGIATGFNLVDNHGYVVNEEYADRYPNLILLTDEEKIADNLKNHYISQLQLLIDHEEFTYMMGNYFGTGEWSREYLQKRLDRAKEEINIYGVRVIAKKNELLKMMDELNLSYVQIQDVKLSTYSK